MLYTFYLLIASLKYWVKPKLAPLYVLLSFAIIPHTIHFSLSNITRFLTYEIFPWPMRRQGFLSGNNTLTFPLHDTYIWFTERLLNDILPGIWNTVILTQIVLVGTGLFALIAFPIISHHFFSGRITWLGHIILIVIRTTPEYMLAYLFLQLWGPSMLPAIAAIALHNGAILAFLSGQNANLLRLRLDAPETRARRYLYETLPRIYGQFLVFLFYRWEVMMRESAILGILGIYTLGFFIDSAIAEQKMDRVILLIFVAALLNMGIDTLSQRIRKSLQLSTGTIKTIL